MPLIIGGDFNIHVNDSCDNSAKLPVTRICGSFELIKMRICALEGATPWRPAAVRSSL